MIYIATFFSHFGAMRFDRNCKKLHIPSRIMPVPREFSSSCGSCVHFENDIPLPEGSVKEEIEKIILIDGDTATNVFENL